MCIGHGLCVSELSSFLHVHTYIVCGGCWVCLLVCPLCLSLLCTYLFLSQYSVVLCAMHVICSCTFMQASMTCIFIYMYITAYSFLKAVSSFTISLSFPNASVLYTYFSCIQ